MRLITVPLLTPRIEREEATFELNPEAVAKVAPQSRTLNHAPWCVVTLLSGETIQVDASRDAVRMALLCEDIMLIERGKPGLQ